MTIELNNALERVQSECDLLLTMTPDEWGYIQQEVLHQVRFTVGISRYGLLTNGTIPDTNALTSVMDHFESATKNVDDPETRPVIDVIIKNLTEVINTI